MFRRGASLAEHPLQAVSGEFVPRLGDKFRFGSNEGFLQLSLLPQRLNLGGQAPQVDEAGSLALVVVAFAEGHQVLGVQRVGRGGARTEWAEPAADGCSRA